MAKRCKNLICMNLNHISSPLGVSKIPVKLMPLQKEDWKIILMSLFCLLLQRQVSGRNQNMMGNWRMYHTAVAGLL